MQTLNGEASGLVPEVLHTILVLLLLIVVFPTSDYRAGRCYGGCDDPACYMTDDCGGFTRRTED